MPIVIAMEMDIHQQIARVDRAIDANRAELCRVEYVSPMSVASWQRAWDRHPKFRQRESVLFHRRGELQKTRDEAEFLRARRFHRAT